jgi:hypothetical protein
MMSLTLIVISLGLEQLLEVRLAEQDPVHSGKVACRHDLMRNCERLSTACV